MSYSFNVRAASKALAIVAVTEKLAEVVAGQPVHERDQAQAQAAAESFINMVDEPGEGQEVAVSVSGALGWRGTPEADQFTSASVSVHAYVAATA